MGVKGDKNGWVWRHLWVLKETKMGGYGDIYYFLSPLWNIFYFFANNS